MVEEEGVEPPRPAPIPDLQSGDLTNSSTPPISYVAAHKKRLISTILGVARNRVKLFLNFIFRAGLRVGVYW